MFYYRFDHLGSFSMADIFSSGGYLGLLIIVLQKLVGWHTTKSLGVCHSDELPYMFR